MEEKDIDRLFKREKENEAFSPPDFVWDNIEKDLRQNKKKKRFIVWWFVGFLLVVSTTLALYQSKNFNNAEVPSIAGSSILDNDSKTELLSKNDNDKTVEDTRNQNLKTEDITSKSKDNIGKEINAKEAVSNNSKSTLLRNQYQESSIKGSNNKPNDQSETHKPEANRITSDERTVSSKNQLADKSIYSEIVDNIYNADENLVILENINVLPITSPTFLLFEPTEMVKVPNPSYPKQIKLGEKLNTVSVSMQIGKPTFANVAASVSDLSLEFDWYSYGLGINYLREVKSQTYIGAGLSFRQSKRKFNYESEELKLHNYERGVPFVAESFEFGRLLSQGEQRFRFVDFTTDVQYKFWNKGIGIRLGLSAIVNIKLSTEGKYLGSNEEIIYYAKDDNFYSSSLGFGITPFVSFDVPLSAGLHLMLTPNFTTYFQNIESDEPTKGLKYSNIGLAIGVGKQF